MARPIIPKAIIGIIICIGVSLLTISKEGKVLKHIKLSGQEVLHYPATNNGNFAPNEEKIKNSDAISTTTSSTPSTSTVEASSSDADSNNGSCTDNLIFVQDKVLPINITHTADRPIPRVVHLFVKSRCLPTDLAENVMQWKQLADHSVLLHDQNEITQYLTKERKDTKLPFVPKAFHCAIQHEAILDLARLVWLYDHGGISVDIDHVLGEGFLNGTLLDPDKQHGTKRHFIVEDHESHPYPRFLATEPGHYANFGGVILTVAMQYRQHVFNSTAYGNYTSMRNNVYKHTAGLFSCRDYGLVIEKMVLANSHIIGVVHAARTAGKMLIQTTTNNESMGSIQLTKDDGLKKCVDLTNDSNQIDVKELLGVTGGSEDNNAKATDDATASCPEDQIYMHNKFVPDSVNQDGRKVPKIIHMTSKNKCFTKKYSDNADLWKFEGYSFFMHDDAAVQRLIHGKEWSEFPLLKEAASCLTFGAMKADYWRYLATWEFGGIYTDMDNAPGVLFKNGTVIADDDDALFEVERGGFPSQYFYASKLLSNSLPLP